MSVEAASLEEVGVLVSPFPCKPQPTPRASAEAGVEASSGSGKDASSCFQQGLLAWSPRRRARWAESGGPSTWTPWPRTPRPVLAPAPAPAAEATARPEASAASGGAASARLGDAGIPAPTLCGHAPGVACKSLNSRKSSLVIQSTSRTSSLCTSDDLQKPPPCSNSLASSSSSSLMPSCRSCSWFRKPVAFRPKARCNSWDPSSESSGPPAAASAPNSSREIETCRFVGMPVPLRPTVRRSGRESSSCALSKAIRKVSMPRALMEARLISPSAAPSLQPQFGSLGGNGGRSGAGGGSIAAARDRPAGVFARAQTREELERGPGWGGEPRYA
mmetsp:Transcript_129467/g.413858  ORF Transcript_129467/g.413858 Transcript_129467/m.413858 type:complete len:332 (+) Transcript_129467:1442-2437(+)